MIQLSLTYECDVEGCTEKESVVGTDPKAPQGWIELQRRYDAQRCICPKHVVLAQPKP